MRLIFQSARVTTDGIFWQLGAKKPGTPGIHDYLPQMGLISEKPFKQRAGGPIGGPGRIFALKSEIHRINPREKKFVLLFFGGRTFRASLKGVVDTVGHSTKVATVRGKKLATGQTGAIFREW